MIESRIKLLLDLKTYEDEIVGHIEKIVRAEKFDRKRANQAINKIRSAVQILTQDVDVTKHLPDNAQMSILSMIHELGRKGRTKFYLEVKEDGSGIAEVLTGKEWNFKG